MELIKKVYYESLNVQLQNGIRYNHIISLEVVSSDLEVWQIAV